MIATNGFLNSLPIKHFAIQKPKSKIHNGIRCCETVVMINDELRIKNYALRFTNYTDLGWITPMHDEFNTSPLIRLLEVAFNDPIVKSRLLQQPEKLREIMNDVPARQWLLQQTRQPDDLNQTKNFIVTMMKSSRLIWCGGKVSRDVYSEALSRTWEWFMENLGENYNPEKASFVTWFNRKLKWNVLEVIREIAKKNDRECELDGERLVFQPRPDGDWQKTIQEWLDLVQNHSHSLKNCRMQNHPQINCQVLLMQILAVLYDSEDFSWDAIAQKFAVEPSTLRRFCKTRCFRIFKQLLSEE
jgi:hypothetical protein